MFVATGITVGDPFTYLASGDRRIIVTNQLEVDLVHRESTANEIWMVDEFGGRDLVLEGWPLDEARMETVRRMLERAGLDAVAVPPNFPLALGDYLRGKGITLTPDRVLFASRRRHKNAGQLHGIRAAQRATEAAFDAARGMIGSASPAAGGALQLNGDQALGLRHAGDPCSRYERPMPLRPTANWGRCSRFAVGTTSLGHGRLAPSRRNPLFRGAPSRWRVDTGISLPLARSSGPEDDRVCPAFFLGPGPAPALAPGQRTIPDYRPVNSAHPSAC